MVSIILCSINLDKAESLAGSTEKVSIGARKYLTISLKLHQTNLKYFLSTSRTLIKVITYTRHSGTGILSFKLCGS